MKQLDKIYENSLVIFGGSFDPVQNAHIGIIQKLSERFGSVVVVPGFISPFKKNGAAADAGSRLRMLRDSLPQAAHVTVSEYEIEKGGISYTVNTALYIKAQNPARKLYLAIGSDMLAKLHRWHRFDELKALVTFYVIGRPGFYLSDPVVRRLLKKGADIAVADFSGSDASSIRARIDAAFDRFDTVPKTVAATIQKENMYGAYRAIVQEFKTFKLNASRIEHIYYTALTAAELAKKHGVNANDAATAALLHDIAKEADGKLLKKLGVPELPAEYADAPDKTRHAFIGAEAVKSYFKIRKKSIADAVRFHTTGAPKMSKLAKIVFLADYIEPTRDREFQGLDEIRALADKSLNAAMIAVLDATVRRIEEKGRQVYYLTRNAYDYYINYGKKRAESAPVTPESDRAAQKKSALPPVLPDQKPHTAVAEGHDLAYRIAAYLDEKKGRDITLIDLRSKTIIADYFVIASALSTTAVRALTDYVDEKLSKDFGIEPLRRDIDAKWAAIDYGSVILHIQLDETRKFYDLERLWADGTNITRL